MSEYSLGSLSDSGAKFAAIPDLAQETITLDTHFNQLPLHTKEPRFATLGLLDTISSHESKQTAHMGTTPEEAKRQPTKVLQSNMTFADRFRSLTSSSEDRFGQHTLSHSSTEKPQQPNRVHYDPLPDPGYDNPILEDIKEDDISYVYSQNTQTRTSQIDSSKVDHELEELAQARTTAPTGFYSQQVHVTPVYQPRANDLIHVDQFVTLS